MLEKERDARGRKLVVHKLPIPARPVCVTAKDLPGYQYEEGEDEREEGERLAASYVNYYVANGSVIVPQFDDVNDKKAVEILGDCIRTEKSFPFTPGIFCWAGATSTASHSRFRERQEKRYEKSKAGSAAV